MIQLDMFDKNQLEAFLRELVNLKKEVHKTQEELKNTRRGLFGRYDELRKEISEGK